MDGLHFCANQRKHVGEHSSDGSLRRYLYVEHKLDCFVEFRQRKRLIGCLVASGCSTISGRSLSVRLKESPGSGLIEAINRERRRLKASTAQSRKAAGAWLLLTFFAFSRAAARMEHSGSPIQSIGHAKHFLIMSQIDIFNAPLSSMATLENLES